MAEVIAADAINSLFITERSPKPCRSELSEQKNAGRLGLRGR
jgi:hypothetical protein